LRILFCLLLSAALVSGAAAAPGASAGMVVQSEWLAVHLADKNLVVLHVGQDRSSYDAGHIPGARFLALSDIAVSRNGIPNELPPANDLKQTLERLGIGDDSRVVLYGDTLGLYAARAYFTFDYLGRGKKVALLDGGLAKWKTEGRAITQDVAAACKPGLLTVKPNPKLIVELPALKRIVAGKRLPLIDARPAADYSGAKPAEGIARSGHIAGARNVFWIDNLVSKENPVLKPLPEIRAKYQAAGVKPGGKAIVYCRTGIQAAHDYFTLKLAGFRPMLYDASFIEWGNAAGTQIETTQQ
jgi:thiosulfate/3-mercaptopyruvate sulfurtransferase